MKPAFLAACPPQVREREQVVTEEYCNFDSHVNAVGFGGFLFFWLGFFFLVFVYIHKAKKNQKENLTEYLVLLTWRSNQKLKADFTI